MRTIKVSEKMVKMYTYTTTDGKTFISDNQKEVMENAKKHQQQLDIKANEEKIGIDLWKAFGLDPNDYDKAKDINVWDDWDDNEDCETRTLEKLKYIYESFGSADDIPDTFEEFMSLIEIVFVDHYEECKIVMDVVSKYMTTQK